MIPLGRWLRNDVDPDEASLGLPDEAVGAFIVLPRSEPRCELPRASIRSWLVPMGGGGIPVLWRSPSTCATHERRHAIRCQPDQAAIRSTNYPTAQPDHPG